MADARSFCDEYITTGDPRADAWGGCYCKLLAGHDGPHSAHYPHERTDRNTCRDERSDQALERSSRRVGAKADQLTPRGRSDV